MRIEGLLCSRQVADGTQRTNHRRGERKYPMINTLTRWEPMELADVENRLSRFFGRRTNGREDIALADWAPLADITEDEKEYVIKAELPDVKKDDVKVIVENGVLTIAGERKFEKEEKKKKYHRVERSYGSFVRSFALPDLADADKVKAEFKDGMLTVHVPKSEKARTKQVEVKVS
jgi:HSP20 family protein